MKVMRKYFKVVLCFMAFALCSFMFAFSPTLTAHAALNYTIDNYILAINSIKMPRKTVDVSQAQPFEIPLLTQTGTNANFEKVTVRVTDPSGANHDFAYTYGTAGAIVGDAENDTNYFDTAKISEVEPKVGVKALNEGKYSITYIVTDNETGRTYYSNAYEVQVKNVAYEFDFTIQSDEEAGLKYLLPDNKDVATYGVNKRIDLPVIKAKNTKTGATEDVIPVVTQDGAPLTVNSSDFKSEGGKYFIYTDCTADENATEYKSVYKVEYSFKGGATPLLKTYTIIVSNSFVQPKKEDLKLVTSPRIPTVQLGQKGVTLPTLTITDGISSKIDYNLKSIRIEKETDSSVYQILENNDYTFDMTVDAFEGVDDYINMTGNYRVTYNIEDVYGNPFTKTFTIPSVNITNNPSIYLSYDYDVNSSGELVTDHEAIVKDASADLKASYGYDEVKLPALYAYDQVTNYEDLILVRYLVNVNSKKIYYVDNMRYDENSKSLKAVTSTEEGYNHAYAALSDTQKGVNHAVPFKFTTGTNGSDFAGTYNLEYRVISKSVKERENYLYVSGKTQYSITVLKEAAATALAAANVDITNLSTGDYIDTADELTVNITASHDKDTRLQKAVFYYYGEADSAIAGKIGDAVKNLQLTAGYKNDKAVLLNDDLLARTELSGYTNLARATGGADNTYTIDFKNVTGKKVTIVAVALNDSGVAGVSTKTLNIKNTVEDPNKAPTYTISVNETGLRKKLENGTFEYSNSFKYDGGTHTIAPENDYDQAVEVFLPSVKFDDGVDGDQYLQLGIMYYVQRDGQTLDEIQYKYPVGQVYNGNAIEGARIVTNEIGTYYVIYTAMDDAGNTSVVYVTFKVQDSSDPILTIDATGDNITTAGNVISAKVGEKINFKLDLYSSDRSANLTDDDGTKFELVGVDFDGEVNNYQPSGDGPFSYNFKGVGTYTFKFKGTYNGRYSEETIVVNIEAPKVEWLSSFDNIPEYAEMSTKEADKYVYLPSVAATAGAKVTVKVTAPGGTDVPVEQVTNDGKTELRFKTVVGSKGTYTVKYSASGEYGSAETKTFSIKVGDNVAPTFVLNNESQLKQDVVFDGNNIEYTLAVDTIKKSFVVTAKSNGKTIYSYPLSLRISDKDDEGKIISNYSWANLKYSLTTKDGSIADGSTSGSYVISGPGTYTIKLEVTDTYDNTAVKEISFKVVNETEAEERNDTVVGVVLIVISLVVLAGVILFFTLTGKPKGGKKTKKVKTSNKEVTETAEVEEKEDEVEVVEDAKDVEAEDEVEVKEESVEEAVAEETEESSNETTETEAEEVNAEETTADNDEEKSE